MLMQMRVHRPLLALRWWLTGRFLSLPEMGYQLSKLICLVLLCSKANVRVCPWAQYNTQLLYLIHDYLFPAHPHPRQRYFACLLVRPPKPAVHRIHAREAQRSETSDKENKSPHILFLASSHSSLLPNPSIPASCYCIWLQMGECLFCPSPLKHGSSWPGPASSLLSTVAPTNLKHTTHFAYSKWPCCFPVTADKPACSCGYILASLYIVMLCQKWAVSAYVFLSVGVGPGKA